MKVIIVGGVAGGAGAAARLRRLDESAEIILLERGEFISYANCGLPYHLGKVIPERSALLVMPPEKFRERFAVDVRVGQEAVAIDRVKKTVSVRNRKTGETAMESYDKLVIATGASPVPAAIPGADLPGVFHLWTIADMDRLEARLKENVKRAVVIGGGFVGVELAENLHERGLEVTVIQRGKQLLPTLDFEMSNLLAAELRRLGIRVELEAETAAFSQGTEGLSLTLKDGRAISADLAVLSIGVKPNSELAGAAGLALGKRGHIVTDEELRTSDPDIYAVGDVIEVHDPILGGSTAIALAGPANKQARIAADNIAGRHSKYTGTRGTSVIKVGRLTAASTGYTERRLAETGVKYEKIYLHPASNASYYPGGAPLHMKLIFKDDGTILGAQIIGMKGADKRIDVISSAMCAGLSVDRLAGLELAYAPPYASAKDPVNLAGMIAENILNGTSKNAHFDSLPQDAFLLDTREMAEVENGAIPGAKHILLGQLRSRLEELPKDKTIYISCQSGLRGYVAERILRQHGFDAANLSGGYLTWKMFHPAPVPAMSPSSPREKGGKAEPEQGPGLSGPVKLTVDVRALACPGPVVRLKQEMDALKNGETLELLAPLSFEPDLDNWLKSTGHQALSKETGGEFLKAVLRKVSGENAASGMPAFPGGHSAAIVLFSNDLDKAMAALIIACGMAASGGKVGIFFTFWGLSVLRRDPAPAVRKSLMGKLFGWMLPKGAAHLKLSKMNMGGLGTAMMNQVMDAQNVTSLPELLTQAKALGVRFIACEMAMGVMGISREELIEVDEVAGVASFVELAKHSSNTLFI